MYTHGTDNIRHSERFMEWATLQEVADCRALAGIVQSVSFSGLTGISSSEIAQNWPDSR